jgi:hypothetical protein
VSFGGFANYSAFYVHHEPGSHANPERVGRKAKSSWLLAYPDHADGCAGAPNSPNDLQQN